MIGRPNAREPSEVAIGIDDEVRDLGAQTIDCMSENRPAGKRQQAFVAAAHAARSAASKQYADNDLRQFHLASRTRDQKRSRSD